MINICFSLYDASGEYSKYVGTAMASIMANTREQVHFFILHNETLTAGSRWKLQTLAEQLAVPLQAEGELRCLLDFCFVDIPAEALVGAPRRGTKGHMFRLRIPEVLPADVEKLIYMDADTVTNLDIIELWEQPMLDNLVLARLDWAGNGNKIIESGVIAREEYVNSGVMVWDLAGIRKQHKLYDEAMAFFKEYPWPKRTFVEQDSINFVFRGKIGHLEARFNRMTKRWRDISDGWKDEPCIYHFAGDHVCTPGKYYYDQLFLRYLSQTPWRSWVEHFWRVRHDAYEKSMNGIAAFCQSELRKIVLYRAASQQVAFFGIKGEVHEEIMSMFQFKKGDFYVDNSVKEPRFILGNRMVCNPCVLQGRRPGNLLIVSTTLRYQEVRDQLKGYGYCEGIDFIDGRELLEHEGIKKKIEEYRQECEKDVDGFIK